MQGIRLKPKYHPLIKKASLFVVMMLLASSLLTLNASNMLGVVLTLFFSYYYSAPPLRFKTKPPLDSFSNGMLYFFGPLFQGSVSGGLSSNFH